MPLWIKRRRVEVFGFWRKSDYRLEKPRSTHNKEGCFGRINGVVSGGMLGDDRFFGWR